MENDQDILRRVYAQVIVLANNTHPYLDEDDVAWFHELVDQLDALGFAVEDFRFDMQRDLRRRVISSNPHYSEVNYEAKRTVPSHLFRNKVDALRLYLRLEQE